MRKFLVFFLFCFISFGHAPVQTVASSEGKGSSMVEEMDGSALFHSMHLDGVVSFLAFRQAVDGYNKIEQKNKPVLTLIDFTKPSTEKRLFVFDMETPTSLFVVSLSRAK